MTNHNDTDKMNRIIKFRAFDISGSKKMSPIFGLNCQELWEWCIENGYECELDGILMQFAGIKDKNGVEIYEGSIVRHTFQRAIPQNGSIIAPVSFFEGGFIIATINGEPLTLREAVKISNKADGLEVIGNCFENPELLNQ